MPEDRPSHSKSLHSQSEDASTSADDAYKANPFNRAFAVYMIVALIIVGLVMGYFLFFAAKQATPGAHSLVVPPYEPSDAVAPLNSVRNPPFSATPQAAFLPS